MAAIISVWTALDVVRSGMKKNDRPERFERSRVRHVLPERFSSTYQSTSTNVVYLGDRFDISMILANRLFSSSSSRSSKAS